MASVVSIDYLRFLLSRFRERLWVKPLFFCLLSISMVFLAKLVDNTELKPHLPQVTAESIETLLSIMASSMLVIATFSLGSMVSAYASASNTATPRTFTLVVSDDASQNALSTFVGTFIFSIVALTAFKNDYFEEAGLFVLFVLTAIAFIIVIVTFVRWADRIARLGRLGSTIEKVELATSKALRKRRSAIRMHGAAMKGADYQHAVFSNKVGYVQHIDMSALQEWAKSNKLRVVIAALPGTFAAPGRAIAHIYDMADSQTEMDTQHIQAAFQIGHTRLFDDDPRFGLVVLSEIAGRALSPAVNDPGTAIGIIGTFVRLFTVWHEAAPDEPEEICYDRVEVPELSVEDMFDDAFRSIARDGAGLVEVSVRLQKALSSLATSRDKNIQEAAKFHSHLALKRCQLALEVEEDFAIIQETCHAGSFTQEKA